MTYKTRRSEWIPWTGVAILATATVVLFFGRSLFPAFFVPNVPFELQASDTAGLMRIRWNAAAVSRADGAVLEVADGAKQVRFPVSTRVLANGSLDYTRKSEDLAASLILYKDGQIVELRVIRSIGAPAATR